MKKENIGAILLGLGGLVFWLLVMLVGREYQYVTYTLEATQLQSKIDYMRPEGWRVVKKEKIGERVYEKTAKGDGGLYASKESFYDPNYRQHTEERDLYSVTFRRLVR